MDDSTIAPINISPFKDISNNIPYDSTIAIVNISPFKDIYYNKNINSSVQSDPDIRKSMSNSSISMNTSFIPFKFNNTFILTPSQEHTVTTCIKLLPYFKLLVIKGDSGSGKYTVATEVFKRVNATVECFDLCELAKQTKHELTNQDLVEYFESLLNRLNNKMNRTIPAKRHHDDDDQRDSSAKRQRHDNHVNVIHNNTIRRTPGIIYIRNYNRIVDVLTDYYTKLRFLLPLILKNLMESLPEDILIFITTQGCMLPEGLNWCIDLKTTREDMEHIINPFVHNNIISDHQSQYIMRISKTVSPGRILYCMRYAIAMTHVDNKDVRDNITDDTTMEKNIFLKAYKEALKRFSGSTIDIDKDVPKPIPEDNLVGIDEIIDEINTSIIIPMRLDIPEIPIKKGLLLCGPPGTGKTSIGRWLAHQIKGKFYLIGGEDGSNGQQLVDTFSRTMRKAHENAPAVIFIDDGDVLFDNNDTYRAFLTILDGIETNKRSDVCVILTCMNMRKVPSSLLRGGRLEMSLITRLPDKKKREIILERSLNKMYHILYNYDKNLAAAIKPYITQQFISDISNKMTDWNCADIHRCVHDVSRLIISNKGINLITLFDHCIKQIQEQYNLCGPCESTNLDYHPHDAYIM